MESWLYANNGDNVMTALMVDLSGNSFMTVVANVSGLILKQQKVACNFVSGVDYRLRLKVTSSMTVVGQLISGNSSACQVQSSFDPSFNSSTFFSYSYSIVISQSNILDGSQSRRLSQSSQSISVVLASTGLECQSEFCVANSITNGTLTSAVEESCSGPNCNSQTMLIIIITCSVAGGVGILVVVLIVIIAIFLVKRKKNKVSPKTIDSKDAGTIVLDESMMVFGASAADDVDEITKEVKAKPIVIEKDPEVPAPNKIEKPTTFLQFTRATQKEKEEVVDSSIEKPAVVPLEPGELIEVDPLLEYEQLIEIESKELSLNNASEDVITNEPKNEGTDMIPEIPTEDEAKESLSLQVTDEDYNLILN
ncbi:1 TM domain-containing transmembrane protein [Acrasis kona]|uniref:1 TM domain-containing transmembrane protein n=1 Tax=Acrasis kona TaxID=1008807 RepID=A0AAW2YNI3_9EUKA